jgi:hypothetical protein
VVQPARPVTEPDLRLYANACSKASDDFPLGIRVDEPKQSEGQVEDHAGCLAGVRDKYPIWILPWASCFPLKHIKKKRKSLALKGKLFLFGRRFCVLVQNKAYC